MSHHKPEVIKPDLKFATEVIGMGADDMEKCYQCATCSVVCPISPADSPFPRREMLWAQWGLKDKLMGDPNVFLCHQCGDCSDKCPRDAKPGDVLGAIRAFAYRHFATPSFMGTALSDPKFLPALILFPAVLLLAIMGVLSTGIPADIAASILPERLAHLEHEFQIAFFPAGKIVFAKMFPHLGMVDAVFVTLSLLVFLSFFASIKKFWSAMETTVDLPNKKSVGEAFSETLSEFLPHKKFTECGDNKDRAQPHMLLFWSFVILFVVTAFVAGGFWVFDVLIPAVGAEVHNPFLSPLDFKSVSHIILKIMAAAGAALLMYGIIKIIQNRSNPDKKMNTSYADWFFIGVVFAVGATGILSWAFRLAGIGILAYSVYFLHLVAVFMLLGYFPFSKFAHMVYRFTAIMFAKVKDIDVKLAA
jgi:quinone-modifying oxidoreductase subunit QmoC